MLDTTKLYFRTYHTEETLLEDMNALSISMLEVEHILKLEKEQPGYYEGAIERERKWNTKLHINSSL